MDALEGRLLAPKGSAMLTIAKDERGRVTSPNWYLAQASSLSPMGSLEMVDMKPSVMLTESQMILKNDLELIKAQLHAQTKAFQALSHSITLLEQESNQQQGRIKELEEDQEVDITRNLVSIKKMQENQRKCTKILSQLRGKLPENASEAVDNQPMSEELDDIWSAVNTLHNTITGSVWSDKRASSRIKGRGSRHHRKASAPGSTFSDSAACQHRNTAEHSA